MFLATGPGGLDVEEVSTSPQAPGGPRGLMGPHGAHGAVSYTHLTLPTKA